MYRYDEFDSTIVQERVHQFRGQVLRRIAGELTEDEFSPLRLQNGLYLQLHAYMLRIAVPYGVLPPSRCASSPTSRGATTAATAISPRARTSSSTGRSWPTCRTSWSTSPTSRCTPSRPAATASATSPPTTSPASPPTRSRTRALGGDPAAVVDLPPGVRLPAAQVQDRGHRRAGRPRRDARARHRHPHREERGGRGRLRGLGRRRAGAHADRWRGVPQVPAEGASALVSRGDPPGLQPLGRRDNMYKARIKILVQATGGDEFAARSRRSGRRSRTARCTCRRPRSSASIATSRRRPTRRCRTSIRRSRPRSSRTPSSRAGSQQPVKHKVPGYAIVNVSLKPDGGVPGDASADQMDLMADLADEFSLKRCASRTTRTSCSRTCASAISTRCGSA